MRSIFLFLGIGSGVFLIDQGIKELFLQGYEWQSRCISLQLHLNRGVAFSMFAFLGEYLKWIQALLISAMAYYLFAKNLIRVHPISSGALLAAAISNLYDRFSTAAVVDYIYWHCGFDFAIFNFADLTIDLSLIALYILTLGEL